MPIAFRRVAILTGLLTLALTTIGCDSLQKGFEQMQKPTASIEKLSLQGLTLDGATLGVDVKVSNPYFAALPLLGLDYQLDVAGHQFLAGQTQPDGNIPARSSRTLTLPVQVRFTDLLQSVQSIKPGSVTPYTAKLNLALDVPALGRYTLPLSKQGEMPVPLPPQVELGSMKWEELGLTKARAMMKLKVTNPNEFGFHLAEMSYRLGLAGAEVADVKVSQPVRFAAGAASTVEVPVTFAPTSLGAAALNILRGSGAAYSLNGQLKADTPFGPMAIPLQRTGQTQFLR